MYKVIMGTDGILGEAGFFGSRDEAQEWVDDNCGQENWEIIEVVNHHEPKRTSMPPLNPEEFSQ